MIFIHNIRMAINKKFHPNRDLCKRCGKKLNVTDINYHRCKCESCESRLWDDLNEREV